jgi:hypothetical protein
MSGVIGGLAAVISSACASDKLYGDNIGDVFVKMGEGRSASTQVRRETIISREREKKIPFTVFPTFHIFASFLNRQNFN